MVGIEWYEDIGNRVKWQTDNFPVNEYRIQVYVTPILIVKFRFLIVSFPTGVYAL
jgi:hypothetical protein